MFLSSWCNYSTNVQLLLSDILDDMKEECQKYGSVVSLLIPKENPGKGQVGALELSQ